MTTEIFFMIVYFIIALCCIVLYIRLQNRTSDILEKEYEIHMSTVEDNFDMRYFLKTASAEDIFIYKALYNEYLERP